jgi:hypothetical protein
LKQNKCLGLFLFLVFFLLLHGVLIDAEKNCNSLLLVLLVGMGELYRLETLIHQQLNILANDCDLSDKLSHACQDVVCAQSDKQGHAVITNH